MLIKDTMKPEDLRRLHGQINSEYNLADQHTQNWRREMMWVAKKYLLPKATNQDRIKDRSVLQNLNIRLSVFVPDDLQVTNVPMNGKLWEDIAKNCNKVFESCFRTMDLREKYRDAIYDDWLYWVWVIAVDGWNNHKQEPIASYVDARLCYADPKNWQGNKMRYFGTKIKKNYWELLNDESYDHAAIEKVKLMTDEDQKDVDRADASVVWFTEVENWDNLVELYNHVTVFKEQWQEPSLYLTTLWAWRSEFVRIKKIRGLTEWEKADPSEIDLGVKLFRAKPLKGSFAWVSLIDDLGQYQDLLTLFTNLQTEQAKEAALWGRKLINTQLWVDWDDIANGTWAWEVIFYTPTDVNPNITAQNGIYEEQPRQVSPIVGNQILRIEQLKQEADPASTNLATWVGSPGSQTKSEIQTLQQNINTILQYMRSNYMDSMKSFWETVYKSFDRNMSPQRKKEIAIVDSEGNSSSYGFKKNQFISSWDVYILVKSKKEQEAKNDKDFAKTLAFYGSIMQTLDPNSAEAKKLNRYLMKKSNASWLDPESIIPLTNDERQAYEDLQLLNANKKLEIAPEPGQDHNVFINIYKTWLDTVARELAIIERENMLRAEGQQPKVEAGQTGGVAQQLWASMLAQDNAQGQEASLQQI